MANEDDWTWQFAPRAQTSFDKLDPHEQDRITSKLDEIVADEWREPGDYLEPLTGVPHDKLRIGVFRLGCQTDRSGSVLAVLEIEKRPGAYKPGDD
ncbi:MAG: type II toxin-antitoxin system RelE/ParE family toxin [Euryarchaeota archaeon]|jgi:mRNA interferase RelE/StbE|nr:type II toxin-antitoxin system RelE/ParE family toxin [Euryarchaeota archaeon]